MHVQRRGLRSGERTDRVEPDEQRRVRQRLQRVPAGQHLGHRRARREERQSRRRRESAVVPGRIQPGERVRRRDDQLQHRLSVPAADGDSRAAHGPHRRAIRLVTLVALSCQLSAVS